MPEVVNPETHHEKSDVNVRALLWSMAVFIIFAAISHFVLWGMFKYFAELARNTTNPPLTEVARPPDMSIPQQPRLQPFPNRDQRGDRSPRALFANDVMRDLFAQVCIPDEQKLGESCVRVEHHERQHEVAEVPEVRGFEDALHRAGPRQPREEKRHERK